MEAWVAGAAAALAVFTALVLRPVLPPPVTVTVLAVSSALLGWGVVNLRPDPSWPEVALTTAGMALLGPVHVRLLMGPFRTR